MKITVFQSDKGDCLLVEGADESRVLVDGGMADTYSRFVAPYLNELHEAGKKLDAVYVSHIDEDHISGILQMMDDAVAWRIYDYQTTTGGNDGFKEPDSKRPPAVDRVWHNAFHEQVGDNTGEIEDMLAATVSILASGESRRFIRMAEFHQNVATSIKQAINLSRRLGEKQLNIKLNPEAKGKLMMLRKNANGNAPQPIKIGGMSWHIIGPAKADLEKLKEEWNDWLRKNKKTITRVEEDSRRTERRLGNSLATEINQIVATTTARSEMLAYSLLDQLASTTKKVLGMRQKVTVPNLASLMFMVEEKGTGNKKKTVLLTGDGHHEDIIKGLEAQKKLTKNEPLLVDVLKVQHHGSEHNINLEFCQRIIAKNYIFCGNGAHANPDLDALKAILDSRLTDGSKSSHAKVDQPFKMWFNCCSANTLAPRDTEAQKREVAENSAHMKKVEDLIKDFAARHPGKMDYFFLDEPHFELVV
jgi:beta-lactamase superfamily II metal-dependent hydrolase